MGWSCHKGYYKDVAVASRQIWLARDGRLLVRGPQGFVRFVAVLIKTAHCEIVAQPTYF